MMWPGMAFAWRRHDVVCVMARVGHVACGDVWFVAVLLGMTHCMSQSPVAARTFNTMEFHEDQFSLGF